MNIVITSHLITIELPPNKATKSCLLTFVILINDKRACLVTLDDRKSRFLICKKAAGKKAPIVKDVIINTLKNEP